MSSLEWLNRPPMVEEVECAADDDVQEPQIWKSFEETSERFRKFGISPVNDRLSLPVTELCVTNFNDLGLGELETKLNRLDVGRAAELTKETCASPTSLVLALLYLDRLRTSNPKYLTTVSSTDLFLVSLMVASKYLNDDGEEDEVFNDEWATSGGLEKKELNRLELDFLSAIDWKIYVSPEDYEETAEHLEFMVAAKKVQDRGWTTYSELEALSRSLELFQLWEILYEYTIKVTAVCALAYAASLMTIVSASHLLSQSHVFSPSSLQTSWNNLSTWKVKKETTEKKSIGPDESIEEAINERLLLDTIVLRNSSFEEVLTPANPLPTCQFGYYPNHQEYVPENVLMNRLSRSVLALKLGTFRDLMLGPRSFLVPGHV